MCRDRERRREDRVVLSLSHGAAPRPNREWVPAHLRIGSVDVAPDEIAHGLWAQDYHTIINDIKSLGYNTIRIPFSNQMVETPVVPQNLSFQGNNGPINTDLKGLTSIQILDKIVSYAGQDSLKVILDDHRSEAGNSAEQNGLWYTSAFSNTARSCRTLPGQP